MPKTAILTYHSAYNFGSVLQAYATQSAIEKLGYPVEMLNYRMVEQDNFYKKLYRTRYGLKVLIKDMLMFPVRKQRRMRADRFEDFFTQHFRLTDEIKEPEQVRAIWEQYAQIVSGSDQIWNKHSCELEHNDWSYMEPYLLRGYSGRKISYASSVGIMTDEDLRRILPDLQQFDALSFREAASAEKMAGMLNRKVATVLDPTFLLTGKEWIEELGLQQPAEERYIFAYSLGGIREAREWLAALLELSRQRQCKVKLVMPFIYRQTPGNWLEWHPEYGPVEFLQAIYGAEMVVSDSYHGTILSVNFGKEFYSVCKQDSPDARKTDLLSRLGLTDRVVKSPAQISVGVCAPIDYGKVRERLDILRQDSMDYLRSSLGEM